MSRNRLTRGHISRAHKGGEEEGDGTERIKEGGNIIRCGRWTLGLSEDPCSMKVWGREISRRVQKEREEGERERETENSEEDWTQSVPSSGEVSSTAMLKFGG